MYTTMLGMAAFMNWRGGLKTAQGIFWFAVGGILGWPFSMAISAPFLIEEMIFASLSDKDAVIDTVMRFLRGVVGGLVVLVRFFSWGGFYILVIANSESRPSSFLFLAFSTDV